MSDSTRNFWIDRKAYDGDNCQCLNKLTLQSRNHGFGMSCMGQDLRLNQFQLSNMVGNVHTLVVIAPKNSVLYSKEPRSFFNSVTSLSISATKAHQEARVLASESGKTK